MNGRRSSTPAMKRHAANIKINLVPQDPFYSTALGKTLKWAVTIGRYVVMLTELVVILSFAARFSLDRRLTDLNESINQKQNVILSFGELEGNVRAVQTKIEQYQQLEQQQNLVDVFPSLSAIIPGGVTLTELVIRPASVTLGGTALSQSALNLLINNIQLSGDFYNVVVDRIENSEDRSGLLQFRITADTQPTTSTTTQPRSSTPVNILDRTQGL